MAVRVALTIDCGPSDTSLCAFSAQSLFQPWRPEAPSSIRPPVRTLEGSTCAASVPEAKWRPESGRFTTPDEGRGARMRYIGLLSLLLTLSGCALERSVTFVYYPNAPHSETFPPRSEFDSDAQKECARYGLVAVHDWDNYTTYQRVRVSYKCVAR